MAVPLPTRQQSPGSGVLPFGIFLAALLASCLLLGRFLPFPQVLIVRDKMEYLARHGDEYDVIFIGSSHVQSQVMPSVFDQVAAANGVPVKSFNAGVAGMFSPEDGYVFERILRRPHRHLRWVFFELSAIRTSVERQGTARFNYWHDWPRVGLVVRRLWRQASEESARTAVNTGVRFPARWAVWSAALEKMTAHLRQWLDRLVNLGRGTEVLERWMHPRDEARDSAKSLGPMHDGWMSAFGVPQQMAPEPRATYMRNYDERLAVPATKERDDPVSQLALKRLVDAVRGIGATPIFIIPPMTEPANFYPTIDEEKELAVLDFSDVRKNSELYLPEHRIDPDHLNTAGARIFSEELAQSFVALARKTGPAP